MKKVTALLFSFLLVGLTATAASVSPDEDASNRGYGKSYIFTEGEVEFSVFPDGQFDFVYVGSNQGSDVNISVNAPGASVSYNAGYDYEAYVQYDDYGAIIQIEDVAVYYDENGRIVQAGDVEIRYHRKRIVTVGGLFIHYNSYGYYSHHTGFINAFNPYYVYRPWHVFYSFPFYNNCVVYDYPYRRFYTPIRYSYYNHTNYYSNRHRVAYQNGRRDFYRPGSRTHHRDGRIAKNRDYNPRRTNTAATNNARRDRTDYANATRGDRNSARNSNRSESINNRATTKGRPATTSRNDKRDRNVSSQSKGRSASNRGDISRKGDRSKLSVSSRPTQGRPNAQRNAPSFAKRDPVATSKERSAVNNRTSKFSRPKVQSRPVAKAPSKRESNTNRSVTKPSSSRKNAAKNSRSRTKSNAPSRSSKSKSTSSRRGRGL
ncbi:MAG: hypothetical protein ACI917_001818 [Patiriisocius sp.]|jgi:hypothetical protein